MHYTISGKVVTGKGYGRRLGYPTVNLDTELSNLPPKGVYAGKAITESQVYCAGIVITPEDKIEAHLIGYSGDLYGKTVTLELEKFLREYKNFESEEKLKEQIKKDLEQCLRV
jgi:riboflavin kinase / FMN adenylyltransferase